MENWHVSTVGIRCVRRVGSWDRKLVRAKMDTTRTHGGPFFTIGLECSLILWRKHTSHIRLINPKQFFLPFSVPTKHTIPSRESQMGGETAPSHPGENRRCKIAATLESPLLGHIANNSLHSPGHTSTPLPFHLSPPLRSLQSSHAIAVLCSCTRALGPKADHGCRLPIRSYGAPAN